MIQVKLKLNKKVFLFILAFAFFLLGCFLSSQFLQPFLVLKVIDGDTIVARVGFKNKTIRLLGIDTPEIKGPYTEEECFEREASKKTKNLLFKKRVYLLKDPNAPDRDKYGRLLRYVFLEDGEFVNAKLVKEGYAFAYILEPIEFGRFFEELEKEAKQKKLGLWGVCSF
ncbi:MAG: thermonuclease family protein [Candidatus Pacebacteria bacterium]|nr:thermonuclease family protein [Candidatus Paceibacterota bacterium]